MPRGFSTTSDTPTEARTTGEIRDRQLAVVVTCLCLGGPYALPLDGSCLGKTCGVLDGLTAPESERPLVRRIILTENVIPTAEAVWSVSGRAKAMAKDRRDTSTCLVLSPNSVT